MIFPPPTPRASISLPHLQEALQDLPPSAVAAEHQGAVAVLVVEAEVRRRHIQVAAVAGQLLGGELGQHCGPETVRIGGVQEGIQEEYVNF